MRKLLAMLTVSTAMAIFTLPASAELGSDVPSDDQLLTQRIQEAGTSGSGIFDIAPPPDGQTFSPVNRVPRDRFGVVGPFPLQLQDLNALVYPDATLTERQALLEGLTFFTTSHTAPKGWGRSTISHSVWAVMRTRPKPSGAAGYWVRNALTDPPAYPMSRARGVRHPRIEEIFAKYQIASG
jgi:hypothetical protein